MILNFNFYWSGSINSGPTGKWNYQTYSHMCLYVAVWETSVLLGSGSKGGAVSVHHHEPGEWLEHVGQDQDLVPTYPRRQDAGCHAHWSHFWR